MDVTITNRDNSAREWAGWRLKPTRLTWGELGCVDAEIEIDGVRASDIWDVADLLRCPVIVDDYGFKIWWGFVNSGEIITEYGLKVSWSLNDVYNRVRCSYQEMQSGAKTAGGQTYTDWAEDATSIGIFGRKELTISSNEASLSQAEADRDRALIQLAWPIAVKDFSNLGVQSTPSAKITCRGWSDLLWWRYYQNLDGYISYPGTREQAEQNLGDATANTEIAQSFELGSTGKFITDKVGVRIKCIGSPSDTLKLELRADSSGPTGSVIANVTISPAAIPDNTGWTYLELDYGLGALKLEQNILTKYWLRFSRTGSIDASNYYVFAVDQGYSTGELDISVRDAVTVGEHPSIRKDSDRIINVQDRVTVGETKYVYIPYSYTPELYIYNGSTWAARAPAAILNFEVLGTKMTSSLIQLAWESNPDIPTTINIDDATYLYASPYRGGDRYAGDVIMDLIKSGMVSGTPVHLLVDTGRNTLNLTQEPTIARVNYYLDIRNRVHSPEGPIVRIPPVFEWVNTSTIISPQPDVYLVQDPTFSFIISATWKTDQDGRPGMEYIYRTERLLNDVR